MGHGCYSAKRYLNGHICGSQWPENWPKCSNWAKNVQKMAILKKMDVRMGKMAITYWIPCAMDATVQKGT